VTAIPVRWLTVFLDFPADSFGARVAFWREVTGSTLSPFRGAAGEFATLLPADGDAYLRVQRVAGRSGGHHLDLHVDPALASVEQAAERAVALGAKVLHRELGLVISASPGGFTFCLVRWHGEHSVPRPVRLDGGGRQPRGPVLAGRTDRLLRARALVLDRADRVGGAGWRPFGATGAAGTTAGRPG